MRITDFRRGSANHAETAQRPQEFVRNAFDVDRRNTRFVQIARVTNQRRGWRTVTVTKVAGQRARRHVQFVHMPSDYRGRFRTCRHIRIDCDCGRHVFVWNHALYEAGLAIRDRTNGQPADATNPEGRLGACKHQILVLRYLIRANPQFPHTTDSPEAERGRGGTINLTTLRQARNPR